MLLHYIGSVESTSAYQATTNNAATAEYVNHHKRYKIAPRGVDKTSKRSTYYKRGTRDKPLIAVK